ncbi:septum formation inhibitor Maf [Bacillus sp. V3-13]|uniref:Maf family protein n=1 Tax=Bacillus sp. V3-13 TaxID=2053728 RepID=UPI000C7865CE|nr:Maf family protein [Bacillus sp. V3-13]PLR75507.1 septum formation inhibitor Maf [Bacillus sp. V3-13]
MQRLILASSSPRRKELLENLHLEFEISGSDVDEIFDPQSSPEEIVTELADRKARFVAGKFPSAFILGSDTIVVSGGKVLGKPEDEADAVSTLRKLSGKTHAVFTGVSIIGNGKNIKFYEKTDVTFWELTDEEIKTYVNSGEPFDKAGSYGIQGLGSMLVKEIKGDFFTVMGLPVSRTVRELRKAGFELPF